MELGGFFTHVSGPVPNPFSPFTLCDSVSDAENILASYYFVGMAYIAKKWLESY